MTKLQEKVDKIKELLENEAAGEYVTFYDLENYISERGLKTVEEGFEDIKERQERGDDITLQDLLNGFLLIDASGSTEFRVYTKETVLKEKASYFEM